MSPLCLVSMQQMPVEVLRKIFDELFHISEAYRWDTPRLRYLEWMTVCKLWHSLMLELLYSTTGGSRTTPLILVGYPKATKTRS